MKKRLLSLLLVFAMLLSSTVTVFAVEAEEEPEWDESAFSEEVPSEDAEALAEWEASLGEYTETPVNAYTPAEAKNLLTAEDTGHAYDPDMGEEEETPVSAEYVPGEVLFSRMEGGFSLFGDDDIESELASLGISGIEQIASFANASEGISLFGAGSEEVWYQASVSGDVLETVEALKELNGIENAEPNYIYTTEVVDEPSAAQIANQWYLNGAEHGNTDNNGLHKGWYKHWDKDWEEGESTDDITATSAPGTGVVVAVIDTGVDYTHEDLASSMWTNPGEIPGDGIDNDNNGYVDDYYGINATANPRFDGALAGDPMDNNGHGTHVAGIIAMADNDVGGIGIAYGAKIMAIKAGQSTGTFASTDIEKAIKYAVAMNADVINMSFGGTGRSALIEAALEQAFSTCVLVAAAGNDGLPTNDAAAAGFLFTEDIYPAGYSYVLGVMSSDQSGNLASYSNWDFKNDANCEYEMIAPGSGIYSTIPGNRYADWNGTSMAAPMVSAAAAVIRGYFGDKDEYNSRFIMGQLASATEDRVNYSDEMGYFHSYASLNLYDSMVNLPKPNLKVSEVFALDNVRGGTENDGDRIIDAGETIDLGIAIRNQWGKTGTVTVKVDNLSESAGVASGFVEFIQDEIELTSIGTYSSANNGFVYEDSLLTDVTNPIRFKIAPNTPNDSEIKINLTVTTTNGWDNNDNASYDCKASFTFRVQKGKAVRGTISSDTVWTRDNFYIVEDSVFIESGVKLTVEDGTQIQFWSSDYVGPYEGMALANIRNNGTLILNGTQNNPITIFPGKGFEQYVCQIAGNGVEELRYCKITNPRLGTSNLNNKEYIDLCDHCEMYQNFDYLVIRWLDNDGTIEQSTNGVYSTAYSTHIKTLSNSVMHKLRGFDASGSHEGIGYCGLYFDVQNEVNNLYDCCVMRFQGGGTKTNVAFVGSYKGHRYGSRFESIYSNGNIVNSALLSQLYNLPSEQWISFIAPEYSKTKTCSAINNYWGTQNENVISKMISDGSDYPGLFCVINYNPTLTLESDSLEDIYPFVTGIKVTDQSGEEVESCAPGNTYYAHVTYNRDMNQDAQPSITYGGAYPFTDNMVTGDWINDREWVGTFKVSSVTTGGNQIFRAVGGCAADDSWLVCGTDENRFQFTIDSASAQSMVLNATGGSGKVDLTWFQNDYELLSGYNIYRSTNPDYGYTKIYSALNSETAYSDTDVQDGVTYYYYFKIVDTDGNEVENSQSNTASASPTDRIKPTITHTKVTSATVGRAVSIGAKASDNIGVKSVKLFYKKVGDSSFASTTLTLLNDNYVGTIPASYVTSAGVQYYLEVEDTAGNKNWSGSADVPYTITAGTNAVVNAVFPSTIDYGYDGNITVYGVNFRNDSAVDLSGTVIKNFTVNDDGTEITFAAPSLPVGAYTVHVDDANLATKLTVRDTASFIQINEGEVSSGKTLKLPVYAGVKGEMTSVHAVITIPTDKFSGASFELASGVNANLVSNYRYGSMTISLSSAKDFNPGSNKPLGYLILTPKAVAEETSGQIVVTEGLINNGEANSLSSATVTVYPNFSISAIIRYFFNNKLVSGVTVKADDVSKATDANGAATLTEIKRSDVVVTASKNEYVDGAVEAYDAVLILQYCAYNNIDKDGNPILTENQILAADVDDDGKVTEADATLILKMAVGLIEKFDAGSWIFVPASQAKTLTAATTNVSFTAIMVGDVDGSWAK